MLFQSLTLGAAGTYTSPQFEFERNDPKNLGIEFQLAGPVGGTTVDVYVQTSFDQGVTWGDIANFHGTTSAKTRRINLSSLTPVTSPSTPGDGALTSDTCVDGVVGGRVRIKTVTVGTYSAGTMKTFYNGSRLRKVV